MPLKKYFKEGQKLLLRSLNAPGAEDRLDALTCYIHGHGGNWFDLYIPYRNPEEEQYPFSSDYTYEILSDAMGIGVRVTCSFEKDKGRGIIRVRHNNDLQLIKRRVEPRRDMELGLGYTKGTGKLRTFRKQWEKNVKILQATPDLEKLPKLPKRQVNISATGVGFEIQTPIEIADLCMLLINLGDDKPPVCTLAEVVWRSEEESGGRCMAGFQFLNILDADRKRLARFAKEKPAGKKADQAD